jgi:hypothetical protein
MSRLNLPHVALIFLGLCAASSAFGQEMGTIKATTTLHPDGTQTVTVTDPEKRTTEETVQTAQGKVLRKTTYLLDDRNQPLGAIAYDAKGGVLYKASYKRDGMNRIDEETISGADGQLIRRRVYSFGANNKVTRVDEYDGQGNLLVPAKKAGPGRPDKKKR